MNRMIPSLLATILLLCPTPVCPQLAVTVPSPKLVGQKAVVKLEMKNNFSTKIESARAICFLLDNKGKMVGQSSKWVIGGKKDRPALEPKKKAEFNFVVPARRPLTASNLTVQVSFSRVILEGGKPVDITKDVTVKQSSRPH